jgi:hypothetical protein
VTELLKRFPKGGLARVERDFPGRKAGPRTGGHRDWKTGSVGEIFDRFQHGSVPIDQVDSQGLEEASGVDLPAHGMGQVLCPAANFRILTESSPLERFQGGSTDRFESLRRCLPFLKSRAAELRD